MDYWIGARLPTSRPLLLRVTKKCDIKEDRTQVGHGNCIQGLVVVLLGTLILPVTPPVLPIPTRTSSVYILVSPIVSPSKIANKITLFIGSF